MSSFYPSSTPYSLPLNQQRAPFSLSPPIWNVSFPSLSFPFKASVTLTAPTLMLLLACSPPVTLPVIRKWNPCYWMQEWVCQRDLVCFPLPLKSPQPQVGDKDDASGLEFATTLGEAALRTQFYKALSNLCPPLEGKLSDEEQDGINSWQVTALQEMCRTCTHDMGLHLSEHISLSSYTDHRTTSKGKIYPLLLSLI